MLPTYHFLGMRIQPMTDKDVLDTIENIVAEPARNCILGNHNLHSLYLMQRIPLMQYFYQQNTYTHADGMSMVLLGRLFGIPLTRAHRSTYLNWFEDFLSLSAKKHWRIYFIGGPQSMIDIIPGMLLPRFPGLQLRAHHGFDKPEALMAVYKEIEAFQPHVILAGMGMPRQERWILEARNHITTHVFLPCGAALEYLMGMQKAPPRWIGRLGFEWLYRLISRPQALYRRYLIEPLYLMPSIMCELIRRKPIVEQ